MKSLFLALLLVAAVLAKKPKTLYTAEVRPKSLTRGDNDLRVSVENSLDDIKDPSMHLEVHGTETRSLTLKFPMKKREIKSLPAIRIQIQDSSDLAKKPLYENIWDSDLPIADLTYPFEEVIAGLPNKLIITVTQVASMRTTFEYTLSGILDSTPGAYDLIPWNSTFGTQFQINYEGPGQGMGLTVRRRAPVPPATVTVLRNGEIMMSHYESKIEGPGFSFENTLRDGVRNKAGDVYTFRVTFSEFRRDVHATATITGVTDLVEDLAKEDGKSKLLSTDVDGVQVLLVYYKVSRHVGFRVLQPGHIRDIQVRVTDKSGEVLFMEGETHIPYVKPDAHESKQYGYANVIPKNDAKKTKKGPRVAGDTIYIDIFFNKREKEMSDWTLLQEWMQENDANVHVLDLKDGAVHSKFSLVYGQYIAVVPFRLVLGATVSNTEHWAQSIASSKEWAEHLSTNSLDEESETAFMTLTVFSLIRAHSPFDGTSWRVYFNSLPDKAPSTPLFFSEEDLAAFSFNEDFVNTIKATKKAIGDEYKLVCKKLTWFNKLHSLKEYRIARGIIMSRTFDVGSNHILTPAFDLIRHSDDPNAAIVFDQDNGTMPLQAKRDIEEGEEITVDYMALGTKYKIDFLMRFGFMPEGAIDTVVLDGHRITSKKESRKPFVPDSDEPSKEDLRDFIATLDARLAELKASTTAGARAEVAELAKQLLESERAVLTKHKEIAQKELL